MSCRRKTNQPVHLPGNPSSRKCTSLPRSYVADTRQSGFTPTALLLVAATRNAGGVSWGCQKMRRRKKNNSKFATLLVSCTFLPFYSAVVTRAVPVFYLRGFTLPQSDYLLIIRGRCRSAALELNSFFLLLCIRSYCEVFFFPSEGTCLKIRSSCGALILNFNLE